MSVKLQTTEQPPSAAAVAGGAHGSANRGATYHELDESNARLSGEIALAHECLAKALLILSILGQRATADAMRWAENHNFNGHRSLNDALAQLTSPNAAGEPRPTCDSRKP